MLNMAAGCPRVQRVRRPPLVRQVLTHGTQTKSTIAVPLSDGPIPWGRLLRAWDRNVSCYCAPASKPPSLRSAGR
jgi:hypothetical protein